MSAGICVMNKSAVALAADSAVTIGNHSAIHNSANKLFAFSRCAPVGAIIYANADFMYVPMELIIKEYKKNLGTVLFNNLNNYFDSFVKYLCSNVDYFRFNVNEKRYVQSVYYNLLDGLENGYKTRIDETVKKYGRKLTKKELNLVKRESIQETLDFISNHKKLGIDNMFSLYIENNYLKEIEDYLHNNFTWINKRSCLSLSKRICDIFDTTFLEMDMLAYHYLDTEKTKFIQA